MLAMASAVYWAAPPTDARVAADVAAWCGGAERSGGADVDPGELVAGLTAIVALAERCRTQVAGYIEPE